MDHQTLPLAGKAALVTGGSRGIGAAIVRRLAEDGAWVGFTYSASADRAEALVAEVQAAGGRAFAIRADSGDASEVREAVAAAAQRMGRLDVLVSNAGILALGAVGDIPLAEFDRMFAVNVRGAFVAIQAAAARMEPGGRIITIGSVVAERSGFPTSSVYAMTKAALAGLVRGIALDLAPRAITVNNVQPGPTETDMNPVAGPHYQAVKSQVPLGRLGSGAEIASLVGYLASPEASFITGSSLTVDGGYLA